MQQLSSIFCPGLMGLPCTVNIWILFNVEINLGSLAISNAIVSRDTPWTSTHSHICVPHTHTRIFAWQCNMKRDWGKKPAKMARCAIYELLQQLAAASATAAVAAVVSRVSLSHVSCGCHPQIFDFSPTINKTINQTCSTGQTNANTNAKYAAYSINFLFVLTIFEIFIAPPKCSVDCTASVSHVALAIVATAAAMVAFACCRWVKRASSKNSNSNNSNNNKRLSRLAKNGKNDKCFTATKKLQQQQQQRQQKSSIS